MVTVFVKNCPLLDQNAKFTDRPKTYVYVKDN